MVEVPPFYVARLWLLCIRQNLALNVAVRLVFKPLFPTVLPNLVYFGSGFYMNNTIMPLKPLQVGKYVYVFNLYFTD